MGASAGALVLRREDDGAVVCERCIVADTMLRRLRGLLGQRELSPGDGIVLRPGWSIHTAFMFFPIDVAFVDADQVVVKVVQNLKPFRASICRGARDVVELAAGEQPVERVAVFRQGNVEHGDAIARPGPDPLQQTDVALGAGNQLGVGGIDQAQLVQRTDAVGVAVEYVNEMHEGVGRDVAERHGNTAIV